MTSPSNLKVSRQQTPNEDKQFWQLHFKQFSAQKVTRRAYCRTHQLNYDRFQYWYNKLIKMQDETKVSSTATAGFIAVSMKTEASPHESTLCTMELTSGAKLIIHDMRVVHSILSGSL